MDQRDLPPTVSVGCDIVSVERIRRLLARSPRAVERLFTPTERSDVLRGGVGPDSAVAAERLAARFAAKEATRKALGGEGPALADIEVRTGESGAPSVWVNGVATRLSCSLSHDGGMAMAVVVADEEARSALTGAGATARDHDTPAGPGGGGPPAISPPAST